MKPDYDHYHDLDKKIDRILASGVSPFTKRKKLRALKRKFFSQTAQSRIDYYLEKQTEACRVIIASLLCGAVICFLFCVYLIQYFTVKESYNKPAASEAIYLEAIEDYGNADYRNAIRKLTACMDAGWDGYAVYQYLADSYYASGKCDKAVTLLADYLQNTYGVANIEGRNVLYTRILEWLPEASDGVKENLSVFLEEAEHYVSLYHELEELIIDLSYRTIPNRIGELQKAGADNTHFWEMYAYYRNFADPLEAWEEISPIVYRTDSYHSRQMTFTERYTILSQLSNGCALDTSLSEQELAVEAFWNHASDYEGCGTGLTDIDPATGKDINGKIKNYADEVSALRNRLQSYDFFRTDPYFEDLGTYFLTRGTEEIIFCHNYDNDFLTMKRRLAFSQLTDTFYLTFEQNGRGEALFNSVTMLNVKINSEACEEAQIIEGSWTMVANNPERRYDHVRPVIRIRNAASIVTENAQPAIRAELSLTNEKDGAEILPYIEVTFRDNRAVAEYEGWKFELILGNQIYNYGENFQWIPVADQIDSIVLMNIDGGSIVTDDCEGMYMVIE